MGFDNIHVWISTLISEQIEESIRSQFIFHDIYNLDDVQIMPNPVYFLAGPEAYIVETMRSLDTSKPMWVAVEGHLRQHPRVGESFKWAEVRHSQSGGVTTNRSWIGQNQFDWWDHPPEQDPNQRRLQDVLSTTELGLVSEDPERLKKDQRILLPTDLLPAGGSSGLVIAPSVFSPTKWTKRSLTDSELAVAFDVPVAMQSLPWSKLGRLFLTGVPAKSLWAATAYYRKAPEDVVLPPTMTGVPEAAIDALKKISID
jgi:hypothetical protein